MIDLAIDFIENALDMPLIKGELQADETLRSAVLVSLFTDQRCEDSELPACEKSKRGYFGDALYGDKTGSKLWLLNRSKVNADTLLKAKSYILDALNWLLEDGLVSKIEAICSFDKNKTLKINITLTQKDGNLLSLNT